jgi:hypothetical protein
VTDAAALLAPLALKLPGGTSPAAVLAWFRQRPQRYHFDPDAPLRDLEALAGDSHDRSTLAQVMAHEFVFAGCPPYRFPGPIDWRYDNGYMEWHCWLCRQPYWLTLAEGYRRTGDDRYVAEWRAQLLSWHEQVPPHYPAQGIVRAIDVGIRLTHWLRLLPVVLRSPACDELALAILLHQVHAACETLNAHGPAGYCPDNHGVYEAMGVLQAGYYLPELPGADRWRRDAAQCLGDRLLADVRPDGVHIEQSPGYHGGMLDYAVTLAQVLATAGEELPPAQRQRVLSMYDFACAATWPNGRTVPLGDTHDQDARPALRRWAAALGQTATAPAASRHFPDAGYIFLRSVGDDGEQARMATFDYGAHGGWHGHFDLLSVALYGYGRVLALDPGCGRYEAPARSLYRSTVRHNTIAVDLHDYLDEGALDPRQPSRGHLAHATLTGPLQRLHAWHDGYSTPTERIVVERQVLFLRDRCWLVADRVSCAHLHEFATLWHLPPGELRPLPAPLTGYATSFPTGNLALLPLAPCQVLRPYAHWLTPEDGPALVAENCGRGYRFATLLVPYPDAACPLLGVTTQVDGGQLTANLAWRDGSADTVAVSFGPEPGTATASLITRPPA